MAHAPRFVFAEFVLDPDSMELRKSGRLIPLGRQTLLVLLCLLRARGSVVSQSELLLAGWSDVTVGEGSLRQAIFELRRALCERASAAPLVQTIRGEGYRFAAPVEERGGAASGLAAQQRAAVQPNIIGRDHELEVLRDAWRGALLGQGKTILLTGQAGVGKTRLAQQFSCELATQPILAVATQAELDRGAPPLWPWTRLVQRCLQSVAPELRARCEQDAAGVLGRLVRGSLDAGTASTLATPDQQRFALFEELVGVFSTIACQTPLLVLFDDLHAADELSLAFFARLAREALHARILVVATTRSLQGRETRALTRVLNAQPRESASVRLAVDNLSVDELARLCQLEAARLSPAWTAERIHMLTQGNALFSLELMRLLASERARGSCDGSSAPAAREVRAVIQHRLECLPEVVRDALGAASVIGEEFSVSELCGACEEPSAPLLEALCEGRDALLLRELSCGLRYRFAHPLLREAAYHALEPATKRALHERFGEWLERRGPGVVASRLHELAHHLYSAASPRLAARAVDYLVRAAERDYAATAFPAATLLLERALQMLELSDPPDPVRELWLKLRCAEAKRASGVGREQSGALFRTISEQAAALGHDELFARAALGYAGQSPERCSLARTPNEIDPAEQALLREALERLASAHPELRVLLLSALSYSLIYTYESGACRALLAEACALARTLGQPALLARVLSVQVFVDAAPGRALQQAEACDELVSLTARHRLAEAHVDALVTRALTRFARGDGEGARVDFRHAERMAHELGSSEAKSRARLYTLFQHQLEGRIGEVERLTGELFHGERDPLRARLAFTTRMLAVQYLRHGETAQELALEGVLEGTFARSPALCCLLAMTYAERGERAAAQREFDLAAADDFAVLPASPTFVLELATLGLAACTLDDRQRATRVYLRLRAFADDVIMYAWEALPGGPVACALGMLASTMGDLTEAARWFEHAIAICRKLGAPLYEQLTKSEYMRMLARRATPNDLQKLRVFARQLDDFGRRHEIGLFQARAAEAERALALRTGTPLLHVGS
jgi:DNA-binding winged helix-turn-helix (wHTH) protein